MQLQVPVSVGEVLDKITILQINRIKFITLKIVLSAISENLDKFFDFFQKSRFFEK